MTEESCKGLEKLICKVIDHWLDNSQDSEYTQYLIYVHNYGKLTGNKDLKEILSEQIIEYARILADCWKERSWQQAASFGNITFITGCAAGSLLSDNFLFGGIVGGLLGPMIPYGYVLIKHKFLRTFASTMVFLYEKMPDEWWNNAIPSAIKEKESLLALQNYYPLIPDKIA